MMTDITKTDLHMHTTVSDGSDTPGELIDKVRESGIKTFSLTDHDAIKGCAMVRRLLEKGDPIMIDGVEFSCEDHFGKYHILGYGYDPQSRAINDIVEKGHRLRLKKTKARIEYLRHEFGFEFPEEELCGLYAENNPGKPHIGNMMVRCGYASSKDQAIRDFLDKKEFPDIFIGPDEAIESIVFSGGIPVLAHPAFGSGRELITGEAMDARVNKLTEMGIKGLEAYYSGFSTRITAEQTALAEKYDLYITAGSDYHGSNKKIKIGQTNIQAVPEGIPRLEKFLEDVCGISG